MICIYHPSVFVQKSYIKMLFELFIGKIVPFNISSLEEVSDRTSGRNQKAWAIGNCWGWTT